MIFMTKYSPIACLSKAALFTDLPIELKETSLGGLALEFENEKN